MRVPLRARPSGRTGAEFTAVVGRIGRALAVAMVALQGGRGLAEEATPAAATLLFGEPQLAGTRPGQTLDYAYALTSDDQDRFGPSFDDHVRLTMDKGTDAAARTVRVALFSGVNAKPAGPFYEMTGNPLLSLILEGNVQKLGKALHANPLYLKNAIRRALRGASVVRTDVAAAGATRPGWLVSAVPFKDDANAARMGGLDRLTYAFRVVRNLPGEIVQIDITAPKDGGGTLFEERVDYVGTD